MEKNIDADADEKKLNRGIELSSNKKEMDRHEIIGYCPTSIKEGLSWLYILNIMDYTTDRIENNITLLT